jgi:citrate lyase subunit beta / citryl-CoA lyase
MGLRPLAREQRPLRSISYNFDEHDDIEQMRTAYELGSDAVTFELEDHVPPGKKAVARANIRQVLEELGQTKPTFVRVNRTNSAEILSDLEAVVCPELHAVFLPKVESPEEILLLDGLLALFEQRAGVEEGQILILPLLESARGNRLAFEIASASSRVAYMGGMVSRNGDPAISIGFEWTPEMQETLYIRQKVLLDVRSAGVRWPVSGNWNPLDDAAGLEKFAIQSRRIGYVGLTCIPVAEHVEVIHRVFTPSQEEVDYWAEIVPIVDAAGTDVRVEGEVLPPNKAKWGRRRLELASYFGVVPSRDRRQLAAERVGGLTTHIRELTHQSSGSRNGPGGLSDSGEA